jgi:hypothetical protein
VSDKDPKVIDIVPRREGEEDMPREKLAELRKNSLGTSDDRSVNYDQEAEKETTTSGQDKIDRTEFSEYRPRTRFTIINALSGERIGVIHKPIMDSNSLKEILPNLGRKSMRIEKIVWADYDEVEIYVIDWK